jgi:L-lactate dehydrogenase complex protein LldG
LEESSRVNGREQILGRIREALRTPAKRPPGEAGSYRAWLPRVSPEAEDQEKMFARMCTELKTEFIPVPDISGAASTIEALAERESWTLVAYHADQTVTASLAGLKVTRLEVRDQPMTDELEKASAGITACDALVAQTGGVLLTSRSAGGRTLSVLPPHHVVIARQDQLFPDLLAAFQLLQDRYGDRFPSFCTFITGPSRTGDIERVLVLGAHGPGKLTIIFVRGYK